MPAGIISSGRSITQSSAIPAGSKLLNLASSSTCAIKTMCVNGIETACTGTTWADASSTGCNKCIPNHNCIGTPGACLDGTYLATLVSSATSTPCTTCNGGYICKQNWYGQVKLYPGTFTSSKSSWTECPEGSSCSDTAATGCPDLTYSSRGDIDCNDSPIWLRFASTRSHISMTKFDVGWSKLTSSTHKGAS